MRTNGESKFLLIGLALVAIGGLAALLTRKETRKSLRESRTKTLDYLNQQGKKLREITEGIVEKGKSLMSLRCCSVDATEVHQEERRETLGG
jgi:gas vesicle protein